jgi:4-hydroxythreonine-4-phosphate dehydrogenase
MQPKIAISVGDLNGIGLQLILHNHKQISKFCTPIYCINRSMLQKGAVLLNTNIPKDIKLFQTKGEFKIKPSKISKKSGLYSFDSFYDAINLCKNKKAQAIVTLPINKKAWELAKINYVGHTDALRDIFKKDAIMMLGCKKLFVALYTEHTALKNVPKLISTKKLIKFFIDFKNSISTSKIGVLALNPHASDNGVLGNEEIYIKKAIKKVNRKLNKNIFKGPLVPDIAFTKNTRKQYKYMIAMYHDQGLAPLKALYFDQSINVSLNLPIIRTSVDHGTAFDIAYKNINLNSKSYINAVKEAVKLIKSK